MTEGKRSIPEIREYLRQLASDRGIPELADVADELRRRPPVRRAPRKSPPLTPQLAEKIREYAKANPQLHQHEIASKFDVNPGRVSEALNKLA